MMRRAWPQRFYDALLAVYPADFRAEYGVEMARIFRRKWRDEPGLLLLLEAIADSAVQAPKEHYQMWMNDLRYAARALRNAPVFTVAAILTMALGIGANTAIFSVVRAVMLRPLPLEAPERLVRIWEKNDKLKIPFFSASVLNYLSWKEQAKSFEEVAAFGGANLNLSGEGDAERIPGAAVTTNLFQMLGVKPVLGRAFEAGEERPGNHRVALLSQELWARKFGSDAKVLGKQLTINRANFTVIGVAPAGFHFPSTAEMWVPMIIDARREQRGNHVITAVARLRPGVTLQAAQAEMDAIARELAKTYPQSNDNWSTTMATFYDWIVPEQLRRALLVLLGSVGLVMLIACANVANLLYARSNARRREIAVRLAMGAGKGRLIRQLLTESLLLGVLGGTAGVLLAAWGVSALRSFLPPSLPRSGDIHIDGMVLAFSAALSLGTALLFGLAPALDAARTDLSTALKQAGRGLAGSGSRTRYVLVAAEMGLATVLLIGAGLLIASFRNLQRVQLGFRPDRVLTMQVALAGARYPDAQRRWEFYRRLLEAVNTIPGVTASGVSSGIPFGAGDYTGMPAKPVGPSALPPGEPLQADWRIIGGDYFRTLEIPLLRGRLFSEHDGDKSPCVLIFNEEMARLIWPGEDAIGRQVSLGQDKCGVVGIVGNVRHANLVDPPPPTMYIPAAVSAWGSSGLVVRSSGDAAALAPIIRQKIKELDSAQPVSHVRMMEAWLDNAEASPRFNTLLLGLFALVALTLAAVGIYGLLAYAVSQRTQEIGVRMALGAGRGDIVKMVVGQGMALGAAGIGLGLAAASLFAKVMSTMLFGVEPRDLPTFAIVALAIAAIALVACYLPARRATRVDPVIALRYE